MKLIKLCLILLVCSVLCTLLCACDVEDAFPGLPFFDAGKKDHMENSPMGKNVAPAPEMVGFIITPAITEAFSE